MEQFRDRRLWLADHLEQLLLWLRAGRPGPPESFPDLRSPMIPECMMLPRPIPPARPNGPPDGWPSIQELIESQLPAELRFLYAPDGMLSEDTIQAAAQHLRSTLDEAIHVLRRVSKRWVIELPRGLIVEVDEQPGIRYLRELIRGQGQWVDLSCLIRALPSTSQPVEKAEREPEDLLARRVRVAGRAFLEEMGTIKSRPTSDSDGGALRSLRDLKRQIEEMLEEGDMPTEEHELLGARLKEVDDEVKRLAAAGSQASGDRRRVRNGMVRLYEKLRAEQSRKSEAEDLAPVSPEGEILNLAAHLESTIKIRNSGGIYSPPPNVRWFV